MPTDAARHHLYETVRNAWGRDDADALMSLLPPVGWAEVATKQDLALLEARLDGRIAVLEAKLEAGLAGLRAEMQTGFRRQTFALVGAMVGLTAIFSAVVTVAG